MPVKTQWFKDRLAERQMSQRALARAMGLDSAALSLMFRGRRHMKISEAIEIARLLGRTPEEVMAAAGAEVLAAKQSRIPLCGSVDGSGEVHTFAQKDWGSVPHPGVDIGPHAHAVHCRTAGSEIDFMDGWMLYVDYPPRAGVPAESVGRLSICMLSTGIQYLAKPTRGYTRGRWHLNGPAATAEDAIVQWAVPVLHIAT